MELFELKQLAYDRTGDFDKMNAPDRPFYLEAATLYDSVRKGSISKDEGLSKMIRLELRHERDTADQRLNTKISLLWKRIESKAIAFAHEANLENAEHFYAAVYDLPNDWRLKR